MCFEQTKEANHFLCKKKIAFRVNSEIVVEFSQYGRRHRTGARLKVPVEQRNHSVPAGCPQEEFPVNTAAQQALDRIFTLISELVARARSEKRESAHHAFAGVSSRNAQRHRCLSILPSWTAPKDLGALVISGRRRT